MAATLADMDVIHRLQIPIRDLSCGDAPVLRWEIERAHGTLPAYINPLTDTAYVNYDPSETDPTALVMVILNAGFHTGSPVAARAS